MAKSLRASTKKANKARLRKTVFGPVEAARNERLSGKLLELASKPRPPTSQDVDVDMDKAASGRTTKKVDVDVARSEV
jgi:hypothetical protein